MYIEHMPDTTKTPDTLKTPCECGEITGHFCAGETAHPVTVEHMPEHLRASHVAAGNRGRHPHNGSVRLQLHPECAVTLVDGDWTTERTNA